MRVDEAWHHDLAPQIDVPVFQRAHLLGLPRVHFDNTAALTIYLDRDILDELLLRWVEQHGGVHSDEFTAHLYEIEEKWLRNVKTLL